MYRQYLEEAVRLHVIRALALKLNDYKPYDPIYSVIKQDIKVLMGL
jgi:hypothetical protein